MSADKMEATATAEVDEKLYSRQLYVMGHEAQRRMMASNALVIGVSGLGVEIAKNCILAGIHSVTLCDPNPVNSFDLGGNFYLNESQIGTSSRASLCAPKLAELNPYVSVKVADNLSSMSDMDALLALVDGMTAVVVTIPLPKETIIQINNKCRQQGACFIYSLTMSVFSMAFCDFGDNFVVSDKDGEAAAVSQIETILPENPAVVKVLEDQGRHGLETGDKVTFARLRGDVDGFLEDNKEYSVRVTGPYTFELIDVDLSQMEGTNSQTQGYITQVKQPVTMHFEPYDKKLQEPGEFMLSDFAKFDRPTVLHLGFQAIAEYMAKNDGELPSPGDTAAINQVMDIAKSLDTEKVLADNKAAERILTHLASGSKAVLSPMCATLGGMIGQEVLKACSAKFTPIQGFFYFDAD
eukprot:CAMPEP_0198150574 /NCGR_PEP_ID=MMETSP1443-20131203/51491_1 /TAXON_ID=186043 /ORGANISM="Entomoneis sp., Strain CCMP2396" /LENGTH=409 /DNA_ID=CAMNT_0043815923 /DNA_START=29 /DNA_END=1255 /DNA_ORIENTATION=-